MAQIIQKISVDVSNPNFFKAIVAKQYDSNSRFLNATLTHNGEKIEVLPTSTVTINARRKYGGEKSFYGVVNDDGTVTVPLTYWMLELEGTVDCDISVIDAEDKKLSTTKFVLEVEKASCKGENIEVDDDCDVVVKLIEDVNELKEKMANVSATDQEYNPTSENAQSGKAVAEALEQFQSVGATTEQGGEIFNLYEDTEADIESDSISLGKQTLPKNTAGQYAHAEGVSTAASGEGSHAEGVSTSAIGIASHTEGAGTMAEGEGSHAEGRGLHFKVNVTKKIDNFSIQVTLAEDMDLTGLINWYANNPIRKNSVLRDKNGNYYLVNACDNNYNRTILYLASSVNNISVPQEMEVILGAALTPMSHIEGNYCVTLDDGSESSRQHAEGSRTLAMGYASHTEGEYTLALGNMAHAEGNSTKAVGNNAHSEGEGTEAQGDNSHAQGGGSVAVGTNSFASGRQVIASSKNSTALGQYNDNKVSRVITFRLTEDKSANQLRIVIGNYTDNDATGVSFYNPVLTCNGEVITEPMTKDNFNESSTVNYNGVWNKRGSLTTNQLANGYVICGGELPAWARVEYFKNEITLKAGDYVLSIQGTGNIDALPSVRIQHGDIVFSDYISDDVIIEDMLLSIGNGTDKNNRSNAFEVYADGHAEVQTMGDTDNSVATKEYVDNLKPSTDQTYNPESENAQSGKAVAQAIEQNIETWELVEEIVLTEDISQIERTVEPSGTPYNFRKVMVLYTSNAKVGEGNIQTTAYSNDKSLGLTISKNTNTTISETSRFEFESNGVLKGAQIQWSLYSWVVASTQSNPYIIELNENDTITKVKCSATTLPAGFNIKIYGVRA